MLGKSGACPKTQHSMHKKRKDQLSPKEENCKSVAIENGLPPAEGLKGSEKVWKVGGNE